MASNIPVPKELNLHDGDIAENWKKFEKAWKRYEIAVGLQSKTDEERVAVLLTIIGEEGVELYETLEFGKIGDELKIEPKQKKYFV